MGEGETPTNRNSTISCSALLYSALLRARISTGTSILICIHVCFVSHVCVAAFTILFAYVFFVEHAPAQPEEFYDMEIEWRAPIIFSTLAVVAVVAGTSLPAGDWSGFLTRLAIFGTFVVSIPLLPLWHAEDKQLFVEVITRLRKKLWS